jgi:sulfatase maturation enzyme AslB (radical SAM superfamily)
MDHDAATLELDHRPDSRRAWKRRLISPYDLAKLAFFLVGFPKNGFGSIDVTNRCNLRCRHCYFFEESQPAELSDAQWVAKLEELRRSSPRWELPFFNCSWVGGEPLMRAELVGRCRRFFRYNTVVTNGMLPLPDWRDVNWYLSIDGDEETHDHLRDRRGAHARALMHLRRSVHLGITVACCITTQNAHGVERVVRDCHAAGAKHVTFDFYTPQRSGHDELWVPFEQRGQIIDRLIALRRIYGDFFVIPERVLRLMRPEQCRDVTDHCLLRSRSFAFDASGRSKGKCVMGQRADCHRCGCVVPYYLRSLTDRRMIIKDLFSPTLRRLGVA